MSKSFTSENAEISVVIDLEDSAKVPVKTVKPVAFQIRNLIEPLLLKWNCWTQQLHQAYEAYAYKARQGDHMTELEINKEEARHHEQL